MRKGRLFQVVCYLLERGQSTAAQMAGEFGVSVRTVYRDVETLNAAGIPIYAETGRGGGICLMKGFVMDRALLSKEERGDILNAIKERGEEFAGPTPAVLSEIAELFQLPAGEGLEVDLSGEGYAAKAGERFRLIQRAVIQHHCADITYAGPGGEPEKLDLMPLKLCCRAGGWYLKAYCTGAGEYRELSLSRIIKWKPGVDAFEPRSFPEERPAPPPETTRVILRFPRKMADRVYEVFDGTLISQRKDGLLELRQDVPVEDRLIGRLLALGPGVKVAAPASLREELARRAREIYEAHK